MVEGIVRYLNQRTFVFGPSSAAVRPDSWNETPTLMPWHARQLELGLLTRLCRGNGVILSLARCLWREVQSKDDREGRGEEGRK